MRAYTQRLRLAVISHYGGRCACCGERELAFLAIDHINGGGNAHRRQIRKQGRHYYLWLRDNGYPSDLRVLCHNCNMAIGFYGSCPHQKART